MYIATDDEINIKKATKAEVEAVSSKRNQELLIAALQNPNTPIVLGGLVGTFFALRFGDELVNRLGEEGVNLTEAAKKQLKESFSLESILKYGTPTGLTLTAGKTLADQLLQLTGQKT
jgi:hypothetical protein